jgi:hypothetical protein
MRRREFIVGLGVVTWPVAVRAQQQTLPVIGILGKHARFANEVEQRMSNLMAHSRAERSSSYSPARPG